MKTIGDLLDAACGKSGGLADGEIAERAEREELIRTSMASIFGDFERNHPRVCENPKPGAAAPPAGFAYPSLVEAFLVRRTGVAGWAVQLVQNQMRIMPPPGWDVEIDGADWVLRPPAGWLKLRHQIGIQVNETRR
jgi:hypothetical protein